MLADIQVPPPVDEDAGGLLATRQPAAFRRRYAIGTRLGVTRGSVIAFRDTPIPYVRNVPSV